MDPGPALLATCLLVVTVSYEPTDETAGLDQQILGHLVEPRDGEGES